MCLVFNYSLRNTLLIPSLHRHSSLCDFIVSPVRSCPEKPGAATAWQRFATGLSMLQCVHATSDWPIASVLYRASLSCTRGTKFLSAVGRRVLVSFFAAAVKRLAADLGCGSFKWRCSEASGKKEACASEGRCYMVIEGLSAKQCNGAVHK